MSPSEIKGLESETTEGRLTVCRFASGALTIRDCSECLDPKHGQPQWALLDGLIGLAKLGDQVLILLNVHSIYSGYKYGQSRYRRRSL